MRYKFFGFREQGTGNREQGTGKIEYRRGHREQGTGNREQGKNYVYLIRLDTAIFIVGFIIG
ncbi:hypothetical protein BJP37_09950 [Moorena bouillonii PNG]|uniref:Uncharacterized protein n=1 Tax=Moorena bouillonii PNG TaxID=568701 RepID=A0A1U7N048_9CYAN|nr:hypothetical protein BJP37_09950 [Moorena bouillonii PNG]